MDVVGVDVVGQGHGLEMIGGVVFTIGVAFFAILKLMRTWSTDRAASAADSAQVTVIRGLQEETARLQNQNEHLVKELHKMQILASKIADENLRMQNEIARLQNRIGELVRVCEVMSSASRVSSGERHDRPTD